MTRFEDTTQNVLAAFSTGFSLLLKGSVIRILGNTEALHDVTLGCGHLYKMGDSAYTPVSTAY